MSTRRRDLQRALGMRLAPHVPEIDVVGRRLREELIGVGASPGDRVLVVEERRRLREGGHRVDGEGLEERGLRGVADREQTSIEARVTRPERHRQHAAHGADRPVQRELPHHEEARQAVGLDRTRRGQEPQRDGQVEADALFPKVRRREVHGHALERKREAGVPDRGADALPTLTHRRIREPDRGERGQPLADIDLDADQGRVDAGEAGRDDPGQHHGPQAGEPRSSCGASPSSVRRTLVSTASAAPDPVASRRPAWRRNVAAAVTRTAATSYGGVSVRSHNSVLTALGRTGAAPRRRSFTQSHAGGGVVRSDGGIPRYLLVCARMRSRRAYLRW